MAGNVESRHHKSQPCGTGAHVQRGGTSKVRGKFQNCRVGAGQAGEEIEGSNRQVERILSNEGTTVKVCFFLICFTLIGTGLCYPFLILFSISFE